MVYSAAQVVCCGRDDAEVARRAAAIGRQVHELRQNGLCGTPDEVIAKLATYAAAGASRAYLQILDLADLDHLALIGEEVLPALRLALSGRLPGVVRPLGASASAMGHARRPPG